MKAADSLTIARNPERLRKRAGSGSGGQTLVSASLAAACLVLASLLLAGCTIEVGPPPESDPPLVPQKAKAPPPPPQPTEPQPWSRDLNLDSGPTRIDEDELAEGLVASDSEAQYSGEQLTFESAYNDEGPKSEAEVARERARERAKAAGRPVPPEVAAAPVEEVSARELAPIGEAAAPETAEAEVPVKREWRESRLPPPPKFPPLPQEAAADPPPAAETAEVPEVAAPEPAVLEPAAREAAAPEAVTPEAPEPAAEPGLPETALGPVEPVPEAPVAEPTVVEQAAAEQVAAVPPPAEESAPDAAAPAPDAAADEAAAFAAAAWDAPAGTILVQVSAVQKEEQIVEEWQRLQARYPQVLKPLRLVVEEAKLGDRGVFYRVQAGAFGSQEGATAACGNLIDAGQACFVVVR